MNNKLILAIILFTLLICGCTDEPRTKRVLEQSGYTNVKITGYRFFGCGEDDDCATGFIATAPNGDIVSGVVCSGFYSFSKGATIRLD